jgi:hypothetical protein
MSLNYLEWIGAKELDSFIKTAPGAVVEEVFPDFTTVNASYSKELKRLLASFRKHVQDETLTRPFLYLILGPPGAGKSYLIERLIEKLKREPTDAEKDKKRHGSKSKDDEKEKVKPIVFQTANLSEMQGPEELHGLYLNIKRNADNGFFTVTLLDEFDVRWAEGSAIKYLINPVYDGKYWSGYEFQKFGKCAFFFAGSYLQDRDTLMKIQRTMTGVNLARFLNDMYLASRDRYDAEGMREIAEAQQYCYTFQRWRAEVDPRTDAIFYLRSLDKIRDFLSRIAGNVIDILDVSQPLAVTQDEFAIETIRGSLPTARLKIEDVVAYIEQRETTEGSYLDIQPEKTWVEYKNVLLCERLLRVRDFIKKRFGKSSSVKAKGRIRIDRKLLNYLTVTPLINGMRSLEQLVNMLDTPVNGSTDLSTPGYIFERATIGTMVHNAEKFSDPLRVWEMLAKNNPGLHQVMQNNNTARERYVSVPL